MNLFNNNYNKLFILIVIGIIIHVILLKIKYNSKNIKLNEQIEFNLSNEPEIKRTLSNEIERRLSMLNTINDTNNSSKLNYSDWIDFNNKTPFIEFNFEGQQIEYFIQIWRFCSRYK